MALRTAYFSGSLPPPTPLGSTTSASCTSGDGSASGGGSAGGSGAEAADARPPLPASSPMGVAPKPPTRRQGPFRAAGAMGDGSGKQCAIM